MPHITYTEIAENCPPWRPLPFNRTISSLCDRRRDHSSKSAWEGPMAGPSVSDCTSLGSCLTLTTWVSPYPYSETCFSSTRTFAAKKKIFMPRLTYIEIVEIAHLGGRCRSIAPSHPSAPAVAHKLLFCKHRLVYIGEESNPSPGSSDLIEGMGCLEGSTFTEPGAENGDLTAAVSSRFPSTLCSAHRQQRTLALT
jgi:hypothetical protein